MMPICPCRVIVLGTQNLYNDFKTTKFSPAALNTSSVLLKTLVSGRAVWNGSMPGGVSECPRNVHEGVGEGGRGLRCAKSCPRNIGTVPNNLPQFQIHRDGINQNPLTVRCQCVSSTIFETELTRILLQFDTNASPLLYYLRWN